MEILNERREIHNEVHTLSLKNLMSDIEGWPKAYTTGQLLVRRRSEIIFLLTNLSYNIPFVDNTVPASRSSGIVA